jgi:outer membrane receptor protein involved in Fe transport
VNRSNLKRVPLQTECLAPCAAGASVKIAGSRTSFRRALCLTVLLIISASGEGRSEDAKGEPTASGATAADKGAAGDPAMSDKTGSKQAGSGSNILDLDIDQLGKVQAKVPTAFDTEVTTVTANKSSVGKSAAAVFVVTSEMIRRSGATCIPECLRMVPGLQVAKLGSGEWAISARGFNSQFAAKLLVLVDGRSVYNPLFGGVFWDTLDVVLQDVDRIEVIRGPGATIWGANAVNGVINIITKTAADTQGLQVTAGGGNQNKTISSIRYGGKIGENTDYRLYVKELDQASGFNPHQGSANDAWNQVRGGFRIDSQSPNKTDTFTLQGDIYTGSEGEQAPTPLLTPPFVAVPADTFHVGGATCWGGGRIPLTKTIPISFKPIMTRWREPAPSLISTSTPGTSSFSRTSSTPAIEFSPGAAVTA